MANEVKYSLTLQDGMTAKLSAINDKVNSLEGSLGKVTGSMGSMATGVAMGIGSAIGNAVMGVASKMGDWLAESTTAFNEAEQASAQLNATMASTHNIANLNREALDAQAQALMKTSLYDDDAITKTQALLATFTNVKDTVYMDAVPAIADLATKMGGDLQGATVQVGKALNDPIKGITALSRVGVSFTDAQKATIKSLVETGHAADAQRIILKELNTEFGGSAEAAAKAGTGPLKVLSNQFGNLQEATGGVIANLTNIAALKFADALGGDFFEKAEAGIKGFGDGLAKAFGPIMDAVIPQLKAVWAVLETFKEPIGRLIDAFKRFGGAAKEGGEGSIGMLSMLAKVLTTIIDILAVIIDRIGQFYQWLERIGAIDMLAKGFGIVQDIFNGLIDSAKYLFEVWIMPIVDGIGSMIGGMTNLLGMTEMKAASDREQKGPLGRKGIIKPGAGAMPVSDAAADAAKMAGKNKATGSKNITINIKIDSLVKEFKVNTTNIQEGANKIKEHIVGALVSAVNDSQIVAGQ